MHKLANTSSSSTNINKNAVSTVYRTQSTSYVDQNDKSLVADADGNTNITIKISESNTNLKLKGKNNAESLSLKNNNLELTDNDEVTTPFTNSNDLHINENELNTTNRKNRKNLFRNIFCCFKSSHHSKLASSKQSSVKIKKSEKNRNTESIITNCNHFNDLTNQNLQSSTKNFQNLSISKTDKKDVDEKDLSENININNYQNNNEKTYFLNTDNNSQTVQYNNGFTNNDTNNNNLYNTANIFSNGNDNINEKPLLKPALPGDYGKKCLIIDLDETLVHSSFKQVSNADFIVPVEIDGIVHQVYVLKRPHVDEFLKRMGKLFECVLFTASLAKYADPVADLLDKSNVFRDRLFREACVYYRGNYVKDLSRLGRDLNQVIIIDNSPTSYIFHPDNAVPCTSWFDDPDDTELLDLVPYFEKIAASDNVYSVIKHQSSGNNISNMNNHIQQNNGYQHQSSVYSQQDIQQVPSQQLQSIIYQQQQTNTNINENQNSPDYSLNENKILLSIDLMMSKSKQ